MKNNLPITKNEIVMKKNRILVTRTDLQGKITYVNDEFLKISGFSREEVLGKSHNIIRHPDTPSEIFEDMWDSIQSRRPWVGMIKNRAKNGDFYWVYSNVVPQFKNDEMVEYLSVRYAPKKDQIAKAEEFFEQLRNKTATCNPTGIKKIFKKIAEIPAYKKMVIASAVMSVPLISCLHHFYINQEYGSLVLMTGAIAVSSLINLQVITKYSKTLNNTVIMCYKLAGKNFGNVLDLKRDDLIGDLNRGLYFIDVNLSLNIAESNQAKEEAIRLNNALDNVHSAVMVADNDLNVIYMNARAMDIFVSAEEDIKKQIPSFDAKKILGSNIDIYHKNPDIQREMLKNLTGFYEANLEIAGHYMNVIANPVINQNGERIGIVAEWVDRTEEIKAVREITTIVQNAAMGDFSQTMDETGRTGLVLDLVENVNQLTVTCYGGLSQVANILNTLSHGDLTKTMKGDYHGMFGQLQSDVNSTISIFRDVIEKIQLATNTINTSAIEIASGNNDLSNRTEKQAASLEETAASMHELTSTVQHNSDNATHANDLAIGASDIAIKGVNVVEQVIKTMGEINESSRKIGDIISVIDDIAFQTNILALNAAVEAARAGDQGKGFAVVAVEVRNLAQRAAKAAGEIKRLINDSVEKVEDGTALVAKAGKTMEEIVNSIQGVTKIMSEINAASEEQTTGIKQVNKAIDQMDEVTQQNAALVEESAASASTLEDQARELLESVRYFKL